MPRKSHKYHYIYKTTCVITGGFYIGMHSTSNLEDGYIGSGKRLWYSIRKHGKEAHKFEILEFCKDRAHLRKREEEIVNFDLLKDPNCMNLCLGGRGEYPFSSYTKQQWLWENDPEWRAKKSTKLSESISKVKLGKSRPDIVANGVFTMKNKHHREDSKLKIGKASRERKHTEESKQKISEANKKFSGENNSQFGTCWVHNNECNKKIKKDELEFYLNNGWSRGSKRLFFNENSSEFRTHWVNNGKENLKVKQSEVLTYIDSGWLSGKVKK